MSDSFEQSKNTVTNGNLIGRDQVNVTINPSTNRWLVKVIADHASARMRGEKSEEVKDEFRFFCEPAPQDPLIGLSGKLDLANRSTELRTAEAYKEMFAKRQAEQQFFRFAQDIYAYLMTQMVERFTAHVIPSIQAGATAATVDALISSHVILPLSKELGEADVQFIPPVHLRGMMYYLMGHCHLRLHIA